MALALQPLADASAKASTSVQTVRSRAVPWQTLTVVIRCWSAMGRGVVIGGMANVCASISINIRRRRIQHVLRSAVLFILSTTGSPAMGMGHASPTQATATVMHNGLRTTALSKHRLGKSETYIYRTIGFARHGATQPTINRINLYN